MIRFRKFALHKKSLGIQATLCEGGYLSFALTVCKMNFLSLFNPLSPNSDRERFTPNDVHTLSRDKVMRISKMITEEKMPWFFIKFSQLILKENVWRSVWRICMWMLGLKGLTFNNKLFTWRRCLIQARLTLIPYQTGRLHITGIKYSLSSVAINGPVEEKFSTSTASNSAMATVSILGKNDLTVKGQRMNNTKAEKTSVTYGKDYRLNLEVVSAMPLLEVCTDAFSRTVLLKYRLRIITLFD